MDSGTVRRLESNQAGPQRIVIIGAGFGGLAAAKILGRFARSNHVHITVIDRRNHHLFQPLLYQVAMAGLSPADIAAPIRSLLSKFPKTEVLLGEAIRIESEKKQVICDFGPVWYDYLLLACGANHSYFGHEEWEDYAPGLKTLEQATEIRRRVLSAFELAERESDEIRRRQLLTFVIVGGGPTGVEIAGALGELSRHTLSQDFRHIDPGSTRIVLIEAGTRILPSFHPSLARRATRDLEKLGVTVWTSTMVTKIDADGVSLGQEVVRSGTVIWAAGVKPSPLNSTLNTPLDSIGRLVVEPDLLLPGHRYIFAIGDQIRFESSDGRPLPGQAPAAMQEGRHAALNIIRLIEGRPTVPFHFIDKGQMATIGRRRAITEVGPLRLAGPLAWWVWLIIHVYYLVGFKNKLSVIIQWAFAYLTWRRGARLVTNSNWKTVRGE